MLVFTGIAHGPRRLPPAFSCPAELPQILVGVAEVGQRPALAVPVPEVVSLATREALRKLGDQFGP